MDSDRELSDALTFAGEADRRMRLSMQIKPTDKTVKNILETAFFSIPRFQRPYSWDKANIEDFWHDAVATDDPDYFIGSFVVYASKSEADLFYVVDGQQRLTTITLLLSAIRNALAKHGHANLAEGLQKKIEREDVNNEKRFVLSTETSSPFLQDHIQRLGKPATEPTLRDEEKALDSAFQQLLGLVDAAMGAIELDTSLSEKKKAETLQTKLVAMRDQVLRLKLILIELDNEDDAYIIFETLNTRGKDLRPSDLVKNHVYRLLKPQNKDLDDARELWENARRTIDESEETISFSSFLHHSWLSRQPYTTEKKLFADIKKEIHRANAIQYLGWLTEDVKAYRTILEPNYRRWRIEQREFAEALKAHLVFRVRQPLPMTMAILRDYFSKRLPLKDARDILIAMEHFHAQFNAITNQRTGGGTAKLYAASARQLLDAKEAKEKRAVLKEFRQKLRDRVPSYDEFHANFKQVIFLDDQTKHKALVQYLLQKADRHLRRNAAVDYSLMTIEHLTPQSKIGTGGYTAELVGSLGNLIYVTDKTNNKLASKEFAQKKAVLKKDGYPLDESLEHTKDWSPIEIGKRTDELAKLFYEKILKV